MKNNSFYIIDGNAYFYRSFYAIPNLNNSEGLPTNAILGFLNILFKIINERMSNRDFICICFDAGRSTFRNDMYKEYKANRSKMPDDLLLQVHVLGSLMSTAVAAGTSTEAICHAVLLESGVAYMIVPLAN